MPSIFIGRPSRFFAKTPHPAPQPPHVVEYHDANPGVISSGLMRMELLFQLLPLNIQSVMFRTEEKSREFKKIRRFNPRVGISS